MKINLEVHLLSTSDNSSRGPTSGGSTQQQSVGKKFFIIRLIACFSVAAVGTTSS